MNNWKEKEQELEEMFSELSGLIDADESLTEAQQMAYDLIAWLLYDSDKPELDDIL